MRTYSSPTNLFSERIRTPAEAPHKPNSKMQLNDFNKTLDIWIKEVEQTSFDQLCTKPSQNNWSLAQVCMHLISATNHFLAQIAICTSNNENINEEMTATAKAMFLNNEFPDELIEGPPANANTPQPGSKEQLLHSLAKLKEDIINSEALITKSQGKGKTKHPGLHYFNAAEWFQFAEMHCRHHLRQHKRIKEYLKGNRP